MRNPPAPSLFAASAVASLWGACSSPAHDAGVRRPPAGVPAQPEVAVPIVREAAPLGPLPGDVRPTHEALVLDIDPARAGFSGTAELALHLDRPRDQIWLHGRGLVVHSATVTPASGAAIVARWEEVDPTGVARIALPAAVSGNVTLRIAFDAAYDPGLVGVYRVQTAVGPAVFSKFEAIYARRAFPCFDEPAFKVPFDVTLTVPSGAAVVGNMPIASEVAQAQTRRVQFQTTPALPSYLVAFAVGPFEARATELAPSELRAQALPIGAVALRGRGDHTAFALAEEPALLAEQERYFGVAFPFPKLDLIAVPDFQSGAMENAGAITFRDSALLVDDKVTGLGQRLGVIHVLAHETAHQWFGDLVTMRWWDDLWLNEGFATFLTTRTLRAVRPETEAELDAAGSANGAMTVDGLASARRIRQPIETTHDITNAFDGITYQKGAAVLAMLEHHVGDEAFRRGLHAFLVDHAWGNATTDELVAALSAAAGKPLGPLVSSFLDQPGVPVVAARLRCEAGRGSVELSQQRWRAIGASVAATARWTIPVCVRAGFARPGRPVGGGTTAEVCTVLDAGSATLALPACADWILPNADAAGYYRSTLSPGDLGRLRDRGLAQLSTVERVAFSNDLVAAFRSGGLPGGDVLRALEPLARDRHGAVALAPLGLLGFVDELMVSGKARAVLRARIAKLYAPALASLGWQPAPAEKPWRRLFRSSLIDFLALEIDDPAVLARAARLGRIMLGVDGGTAPPLGGAAGRGQAPTVDGTAPPLGGAAGRGQAPTVDGTAPPFGGAAGRGQAPTVDGTAPPFGGAAGRGQAPTVDGTAPPFGGAAGRGQAPTVDKDPRRHLGAAPDLAGTVLAAAARTGGADVFDALVALVAGSADAQVRGRALAALGATRDAALIGRALDLGLDPRLRANERLIIYKALAGSVETRDAAWAWLEAHFDALAALLPDRYGGQLPSAIRMCDPVWAERVRAFFAPRVERLTGGPRNLAQALEAAEQCAARVAAQQDSVDRYVR